MYYLPAPQETNEPWSKIRRIILGRTVHSIWPLPAMQLAYIHGIIHKIFKINIHIAAREKNNAWTDHLGNFVYST